MSNGQCGQRARDGLLICVAITIAAFWCRSASWAQTPVTIQRDLSLQKFAGQKLAGANYRQCNLTMADFRRADLRGADFTDAELDRVQLDDADLSRAVGLGTVNYGFGIEAQRAVFRDADLQNARIPGRYFEGADFRGADLRGAMLAGRFHDARFDDADVRDTVFLGAVGLESQHGELQRRGAIVSSDDFARTVAVGRDYRKCDLSGFQLAGAVIDGGNFTAASFHSANLNRASMRAAKCAGGNLCYAKLRSASVRDADFSAAHLHGADLPDADATQTDCRGTEFCGANLIRVDFSHADLTGADFRGADLTGANFSGANLTDVKWDAAIIADLRGLSPEQEAAIHKAAARWKHDVWQVIDGLRRNLAGVVWLLTWFGGLALYGSNRHWLRDRTTIRWLALFHATALLPALGFLFLFCGGASPVVQLSGNMSAWSAWVGMWPIGFVFSFICFGAYVPALIAAWLQSFRRREPGLRWFLVGATLLTGLALLAGIGVMMNLAPTA